MWLVGVKLASFFYNLKIPHLKKQDVKIGNYYYFKGETIFKVVCVVNIINDQVYYNEFENELINEIVHIHIEMFIKIFKEIP